MTSCVHTRQRAALLGSACSGMSARRRISVWVSVGLSLCVPCVPALLSVSLVCVLVEVWVGKALCVSEPWGWRAEPLQVATRKSKKVRVGGCEVGRGWMKASEYTEESQSQRGQRGAEQAEGVQVGGRRKT